LRFKQKTRVKKHFAAGIEARKGSDSRSEAERKILAKRIFFDNLFGKIYNAKARIAAQMNGHIQQNIRKNL